MGYKLVKDESTQISKKKIKMFRVAKYIAGLSGVCLVSAGGWMLSDIERKIHEPVVDLSYNSSSTIVVSLLLLAAGITLVMLSYYFQRKGSSERAFLRGTDQYWVNAYSQTGGTDFPVDQTIYPDELEPSDAELGAALVDALEKPTGNAFCPGCKKIVEIKSGTCLECGNPVIEDN